MSFNTKMFLALVSFLNFACSPMGTDPREFAQISEAELDQEALKNIVEEDIVTKNANDEVTDLKGLEPSVAIDENGNASEQNLRNMYANNDSLFDFDPPEGASAEFSPPRMITGASLFLSNSKSSCHKLEYQDDEPTYKEVVDEALGNNICGSISLNFCIRMIPLGFEGVLKSSEDYIYTETPSFSIDLPCKTDSFKDLSISIADGAISTEKSAEPVRIIASSIVTEVYLSNNSECSSGGQWEAITGEIRQWSLEFVDNKATVYAKFRDIFGEESECISDSIQYGSVDACFVDEADYKAENILSGVSIGDVEGTAALTYPVCTSDGQTGCIASSDYQAVATSGLAAKVLNTQSVGGITGSIAPETHSDCAAGGQDNCITTAAYRTMDLSAKDTGGAVDLMNANFSTHVKTAATMEFWDETGARYTAVGDADITEANILDSAEIFGVTGTAGATPDCSSISGSGTWILVPGDPDYGTNDFCVMKYEAKNNAGVPTSTAASTPWVSIDQQDSKTECASLGKGYHLITNDEWMTIATNVAAQDSNWSSGTVGTGSLYRGHSDNSPTVACPADANDANAFVEDNGGTDCTTYPTGTEDDEATQRRTHTLSNGEVIWDFAGNVWEWTSYFNDSDKPSNDGTPENGWLQYSLPVLGTTTMPLTDLIPQIAIDNSWDSSESIGQFYPGANSAGGALRRGGVWSYATYAGVFTAVLDFSPAIAYSYVGFRCAVAVP